MPRFDKVLRGVPERDERGVKGMKNLEKSRIRVEED